MAVSLDHMTYTIPPPSSTRYTHHRSPSEAARDSHLHTIRGTSQNLANRFFDKAFTLIVDPSTRAGAMGEHAPVDALVPSIVAEHGIIEGVDVTQFEKRSSSTSNLNEPDWERLDWISDETLLQECDAATGRANAIIEDSDDSVLYYEKYGSDWIKSVGKEGILFTPLLCNGIYPW